METMEVLYFSLSTQTRDQIDMLIEMPSLYNCASRVSVHQHSRHFQTRKHSPRYRTSTFQPSLLALQLLFQTSRQCISCTHCSPFAIAQACCTCETPNIPYQPIFKHPAQMDCSCLKCDWPGSQNKQLWTADTDRLPLSLMTCELVCTTRRRTVLHETILCHSCLVALHTLFRLLIGDTPRPALYTASFSASSSIRSCFNRATNCDKHSRFVPSAPD